MTKIININSYSQDFVTIAINYTQRICLQEKINLKIDWNDGKKSIKTSFCIMPRYSFICDKFSYLLSAVNFEELMQQRKLFVEYALYCKFTE